MSRYCLRFCPLLCASVYRVVGTVAVFELNVCAIRLVEIFVRVCARYLDSRLWAIVTSDTEPVLRWPKGASLFYGLFSCHDLPASFYVLAFFRNAGMQFHYAWRRDSLLRLTCQIMRTMVFEEFMPIDDANSRDI
ncbi:hypothetical protein BCV70DRAFT_45531 [Testicularia cyperi]|uniref:Uncharacterized protein n=1 Tax=Testicularia cyperi TaxID=1882483 RepID=A0A317XKF8_9BASI|nr:hypothetical protein BCV70DRAFT_45531 [Testicularia cyperi]